MAPPLKNNQIIRRPDSPMPALSLMEELEQLMAVDVIEAEPLTMVPPTGGPLGQNLRSIDHVFGSSDPERGRPRTPQRFSKLGSSSHSLTLRRTLGKSPIRATTSKWHTTGQLASKGKSPVGTSKAPIAVSSNTTGSSVFTPSYTSASPPLRKIMSAGPRMGKKLVMSLDTEERRALRESNDSSSGSVRRRLSPPPIRGPPSQFEGEQEKSNVEKLLHVMGLLRKKSTALMETVSELMMAYRDLEDEFNHLHVSNNVKIKRIAKAINREDLLEISSP